MQSANTRYRQRLLHAPVSLEVEEGAATPTRRQDGKQRERQYVTLLCAFVGIFFIIRLCIMFSGKRSVFPRIIRRLAGYSPGYDEVLPHACEGIIGVPRRSRIQRMDGARVVAIGDVHGDILNFFRALRASRVVDEHFHWRAGADVLVLLGDLVERGSGTKEVLEAVQNLVVEANNVGGTVIQLLGNHEVLSMRGRWKYVDKKDIASFGGKSARLKAFSAEGKWGKLLRCLPTVVVVDRDLFVHAGLSLRWARQGLGDVNSEVRRALLSESFRSPVLGSEGPLWTRFYSAKYRGAEDTPCQVLQRVMAELDVDRMIVGHTVQHGAIKQRCGGNLIMIDTGLSYKYDSNPSALVVGVDNVTRAVYPDIAAASGAEAGEGSAARWVDMSNEQDVQRFLEQSWQRRDANKRYSRKERWRSKLLLPVP